MKRFNPSEIEPKWQQTWADDKRYEASDDTAKRKYYVSGMFPYPSGAGMHIGHTLEHSIVDTVARFQRAQGQNVLQPMGWDAFGLPAENYAIKTGKSPKEVTKTNIANFTNQIKRMGVSIDWSREINTSDPEYYKWTQWVFTKLFERGIAYQKEANQWWCPEDKTVLANEQVEGGKCWRCGTEVIKKSMNQWFFKITDYADALLDETPALDWPDKIKLAQTNWIGKSQGAEIEFAIAGRDEKLSVFTTRPDTLFGATFMVIAPEHALVSQLVNDETRAAVEAYVAQALKKSEIDRMSEDKDKSGVFTGSHAINPATGENIPIWIADYVLGGYGTGAIMAVPAHDERDYAFASKYSVPVRQVVFPCEADPTNPPQAQFSMVERNTIIVHLKDSSTGKYALLDWHGTLEGIRTAIMGGIEAGQTPEQAALAEISEEAGLDDVIITKSCPWVTGAEYAASHKSQNRRAVTWVFEAEVQNLDNQHDTAAYETTTHTLRWIDKAEMSTSLTPSHQKQVWDLLQNDGVIASEGELMNSAQFDGIRSEDAREQIVAWLEEQGIGKATTTYKMRDWLISRQRYWGAPIPIIHCPEHGAVAVPEADLPVVLPEVDDYVPKGESVLASQEEWVATTCPTCGGAAKRETDTMDGYTCSSWYLLRYTDPHNTQQAWDPKKAAYWQPIDMYIGGDHAVAHLLYVRFWNHVFYDMGLVPTKEPVKKLVYHGLVGAEDGRKMSKSLGNVVDPLDIIDQGYGADALRTFELFLGPINENSQWSSRGIAGVYRFLNRAWTLTQEFIDAEQLAVGENPQLAMLQHQTIKKVTTDIHRMNFNTAIAGLMECVNDLYKLKTGGYSELWRQPIETLVQLLSVFAPHMSAELWQQLGHSDMLDFANWPEWDEALLVADVMTIVIQVNGKVRGKLDVDRNASEDEIKRQALSNDNVLKHLENKQPTKVIYVAGRLVSVVV